MPLAGSAGTEAHPSLMNMGTKVRSAYWAWSR